MLVARTPITLVASPVISGTNPESARHLVHLNPTIAFKSQSVQVYGMDHYRPNWLSVRDRSPSLGLFRRQSGFLERYHLSPTINPELGDTDSNDKCGYEFAEY